MAFKKTPFHKCNKCFLDTETGGLDPSSSDIIEIAVVITDPSGSRVLKEWTAKLIPERPVVQEAADVNGYNELDWELEGISQKEGILQLEQIVQDTVICAHNVEFDWNFVTTALRKHTGYGWPGPWNKLDTCAMAAPLLDAGEVPNLKLGTLVNYFGLKQEAAHTAFGDVQDCRQLYLKLRQIYLPAIKNTKSGQQALVVL